MTRVITVSTLIGLFGLVLAMLAALSTSVSSAALALGFTMTVLGLVGALIGVAGRAFQSVR